MTQPSDIIEQAKDLVAKKLQGLMAEKKKTINGISKLLDMSFSTVSRWALGKAMVSNDLFKKLQRHITFNDEEVRLIAKAISGTGSLRSVQSNLTRKKSAFHAQTGIAGKAAKACISGTKEIGSTKFGIRFILTKESFQLINSAWSKEEFQDTKKLIEELRRRLLLIAQHPEEKMRLEYIEELGRELDELWRAYQTARCIVPIDILDIIDRERSDTLKIQMRSEKSKEKYKEE